MKVNCALSYILECYLNAPAFSWRETFGRRWNSSEKERNFGSLGKQMDVLSQVLFTASYTKKNSTGGRKKKKKRFQVYLEVQQRQIKDKTAFWASTAGERRFIMTAKRTAHANTTDCETKYSQSGSASPFQKHPEKNTRSLISIRDSWK